MTKLTKEYPGVLKQRLISVEMITEKKLSEPIDFFSSTSSDPAKLLYRLNNCHLLSDVSRDLFLLMENYEVRFGDCHNKLRLLLDLLSISYKLSFVFVSDGTLQDKLRNEVIAKAGERMTKQICERHSIHTPFTLNNNRDGRVVDEIAEERKGMTSILEVIKCFTH